MSLFNFIAPVYNKLHFGAEKSAARIKELGQFQRTDRVLDLGGGTGRIARFFAGEVQEIIVGDSSEEMLRQCRFNLGQACMAVNAEALPFVNEYFDKVIMVDALHHFLARDIVAEEVKRVLKRDGKIIIEEFNPEKFSGFLISVMETFLGMRSHFYPPQAMKDFWTRHQCRAAIYDGDKMLYYVVAERVV